MPLGKLLRSCYLAVIFPIYKQYKNYFESQLPMINITHSYQSAFTESGAVSTEASKALPVADGAGLEQQYHDVMTSMRQQKNTALNAEGKLPFALKQRRIEQPMLDYSVEKALSAATWRRIIVQSLIENVEKGPGHFSIHRAKDALKKIAASMGMSKLASQLNSTNPVDVEHAAHLLGWLKNPRAAMPLLAACEKRHPQTKEILAVLTTHYVDYSHSIVAGGLDVMS